MGVAAAYAHLILFFADDKAGHALLDNKDVNTTVAFGSVGLGNHQIHRGGIPVGYPVFSTVKQVVVAHINGRSLLGGGVGTGLGLAQAKGTNNGSRGQRL